jgi:arginyl-tRNA synthetase
MVAFGFPPVEVEVPKQPDHGDFATNWALVAAKQAPKAHGPGMNPRELAGLVAEELASDSAFERIEVAGPGFINLGLAPWFLLEESRLAALSADRSVLADARHFARPPAPERPLAINVEFVSVNPNGPITIGSGRGAAYGSALCNVLQAAGHTVHREYYINDGVNSEQMRLFAESVKAIVEGRPVPEGGYRGDYVSAVAEQLKTGPPLTSTADYKAASERLMIQRQRSDLEVFGVTFDTWCSEQALHDSGLVDECLDDLVRKGVADDRPVRGKLQLGKGGRVEGVVFEPQTGAAVGEGELGGPPSSQGAVSPLWLRSTLFGDDMDRVLRRSDGRLTYIASDVAYHRDKFNRPPNADRLVTVLGPDHHGYIGRLRAVVAANLIERPRETEGPLSDWEGELYGSVGWRDACLRARKESEERLQVQIFQLVRFIKDGKPAPMRKRDGNIYALIDLVNEIGRNVRPQGTVQEQQAAGRDVARFFYLMRSHDTTFDFDLDLAEQQSDENPVFYVQYAHARMCGVLRRAVAVLGDGEEEVSTAELHPKERALALKALDLPYEVSRTAEDGSVNRLATYAIDLARVFHGFYDACRVVDPDAPRVTGRRLLLCRSALSALRAALELLGVSAPERMERDPEE